MYDLVELQNITRHSYRLFNLDEMVETAMKLTRNQCICLYTELPPLSL